MSKVYLVRSRRGIPTRVLEVSPDVAKETISIIKSRHPRTSIALYGAKDVDTLRRTQPMLAVAKVTRSVSDFLGHVTGISAKIDPAAERKTILAGVPVDIIKGIGKNILLRNETGIRVNSDKIVKGIPLKSKQG